MTEVSLPDDNTKKVRIYYKVLMLCCAV